LVQLKGDNNTNTYSLKFVPRAQVQLGTKGTILKLMLITKAYLSKISTFTVCSTLTKCSKS